MYQGDVDNAASLDVRVDNEFEQDQHQEPAMATKPSNAANDANDANDDPILASASAPVSTSAPSPTKAIDKHKKVPNLSQAIEPEIDESETTVEERHIAEQRHQITQEATTKLHSALQRIKNVTKSMLSEMEVYLESAESVEVDYVRCQHSQKKEGRRLMEVEPDIVPLVQMNWEQS